MDRLRASGKTTLLIAVAVLVAAGTVAVASIPGGDGVITACWDHTTGASFGALRVIDPSLAGGTRSANEYQCASNETQIAWNQQGPTGPTGPAGAAGPTGLRGPQGPPGASSAFGFSAGGSAIFLNLPGIPGDSTAKGYEKQIDLTSVSVGGAQKVKKGEVVVGKHYDMSSPKLFKASLTGEHFKKATIVFAKRSKGQLIQYLVFNMKDVIVASQHVAHLGDPKSSETDTLEAGKLSVEYVAGRHHTTISLTPSHIAIP
jgi:type VI protein secretion system component Hcp